jgi:hypothetical protein
VGKRRAAALPNVFPPRLALARKEQSLAEQELRSNVRHSPQPAATAIMVIIALRLRQNLQKSPDLTTQVH